MVGDRDVWFVYVGVGWLLEFMELLDDEGVESLFVRMMEFIWGRFGVMFYFAVD